MGDHLHPGMGHLHRLPGSLPPRAHASMRSCTYAHGRAHMEARATHAPVVQPSVSTLGSVRTMALWRAILRVPSARQVVTTAGRPSGIAATANATAILK